MTITTHAGQDRAERLLRLEHTVTRCLAEAGSVGDAMKTVIRAVCETQGWERALASDGFHILTANCAAAGFEMLARDGVAIVISDYYMPGMGGIEFLTHVRKMYPDAVRVVITGSTDSPTLSSAVNNAGIHRFLSKNWDPERLRAEVRDAYRQRLNLKDGR